MKHKPSSFAALGAGLVALSALGYATNPILGKFAYMAGANAVTLGAIRFTTAAVLLWLYLLLRGGLGELALVRRIQLVAMGGLGFAMVSLLYFTALQHIDPSLATGLFYTYPAMVAVGGLFLGERLSRAGYGGLLLTAAGTWLLLDAGAGGGFTLKGATMILAAAVLYSIFIRVSEPWSKGIPAVLATAHVASGAALVYLGITLVTGQSMPGPGAFAAGAGLALCSTILAFITYFAGLPKVGATRAAIISNLEPVFTALLAFLLLGEQLGSGQVAGVALVVLGAVAAQVRERDPIAVEQA